jgi:Predicted membrane protein (DUF2142)
MPFSMRTGRVVTWFGSAIERLCSSSRRIWWTSFVLMTLVSALWALATPPFAGPDEPAHVIRAHAIDHGELTGETVSPRLRAELQTDDTHVQVRAPAVYKNVGTPCFAFDGNITAACIQVAGSTRDTDAVTTAGRHPPAYYAVVGTVSLLYEPGSGTVYLMRFITALMSGALIASAITAVRRTASPTLAAVGLLFAVSPMVLFVTGIVNPSAPEIAAAITLWVCGLILVAGSDEQVDNRLVTIVGISACVLALSRQLAPLWLGLIALVMLGYSKRASLRNLACSGWARLWAVLVVACAAAQTAWVLIVKPLDATRLERGRFDVPTSEIVQHTFGEGFSRYREMIGLFGWGDTPSPLMTYIVWTAGVGFLFFLAINWATRRQVAVILGLSAAIIVVPIALESAAYRDVGWVFWQGRYTLPLAVGLPILSAVAIASTERGRQFTRPRLVLGVGVLIAVAHILAFAQNARRYTVGYFGEIQFWKNAQWSPPLSPLLLTIAYTAAVIAFVGWALVQSSAPARAEDKAPVSHEHVAVPASGN